MTVLRVVDNSSDALRFLEYAKTLPFVEEEMPVQKIPRTRKELREAVQEAECDINLGRTYSMEQVRARFQRI